MDESLSFPHHPDPSLHSIPLLTEAEAWTSQQIEDRLQDLLQVTSGVLVSDDRSPDDKLRSMRWISDKLLPFIPVFELDESAYSPLLTAVLDLLEQVYTVLPDTDQLEEKVALLTTAVTLIEHVTSVVKHAAEQEGAGLGELPSVPRMVPKILYSTFSKCSKEREAVLDIQVKDGLDTLFIKSKDALECFCGLMESMKIRSVLEDEMDILMELCSSLVDFHEVLINANFKLACRCWQLFARLTDQHSARLKDKLDLNHAMKVLSAQLNQSLHFLLEEPEELPGQTPADKAKSANKQASIAAFMIKVLAKISQHYHGCIDKDLEEFLILLLRLLATDYSTPDWFSLELVNKIERDVFSPLLFSSMMRLSTLETLSRFVSTFWEKKNVSKIISSRPFPTILLVIKILEEMRSKASELTSIVDQDLLQLLFHLMKFASKDLKKTPTREGIPVMGNPVVNVDNYEWILTHLCAWISTASPSEFRLIERCLFSQIQKPSGWSALLTCDVWSFIARYGTSPVCLAHISLLSRMALKLPLQSFSSSGFWIKRLVGRLFNFLSPEDQKSWTEEFSPVEPQHLRLFSLINLSSMKGDVASNTHQLLYDIVHSHVEKFLSGAWRYPSHPALAGHCLSIATELYKLGQGTDWLPGAVYLIWRKLADGSFAPSSLYWESEFFSNLSEATCIIVGARVSDHLSVLVNNLKDVVKAGVSAPYLLVSLAKILPQLACEGGPNHGNEALTEIAGLYRTLLSQSAREPHVHLEALEAFSAFAHTTKHEGVLGLCVETGVNESVKGFIAKKLEVCEEENEDISELSEICEYKDELSDAVLKECVDVENDEPRRKVSPGVRPPRTGSPSCKKRKFGKEEGDGKTKIETIIKKMSDETIELLKIVEEDKENKLEGDSEKQIATIISQLQRLVPIESCLKEDKASIFSQTP